MDFVLAYWQVTDSLSEAAAMSWHICLSSTLRSPKIGLVPVLLELDEPLSIFTVV